MAIGFIKNGVKSIVANVSYPQIQSDWEQGDTSAPDFIKRKPDLSVKVDKISPSGSVGNLAQISSSGGIANSNIPADDVVRKSSPEAYMPNRFFQGQYYAYYQDQTIIPYGVKKFDVAQISMDYNCRITRALKHTRGR